MFQVNHRDCEPICVPIEGTEEEGLSKIYINNHILHENGGEFIATFRSSPEAKTMYQIIKLSAVKHADLPSCGEREQLEGDKASDYKYLTYKQFYNKIESFARGLLELGLKPGDKIGIYSSNCIWWTTTLFAASMAGFTIVPIYDSLGPGAAEYILNHAEVKALVVSEFKSKIAIELLPKAEHIDHLLVMSKTVPAGETDRVKFYTCDQVENKGKDSKIVPVPSTPDHPAVIMYTSGSTGTPKGCVLNESNIVAGAGGFSMLGVSATPSDTYLSFLPLAHIYALVCEMIVFNQGCRIGYARGPIKYIMDDIQTLRPTIMTAVPRILNRVYDAMHDKIREKPKFVQKLLQFAISLKAKAHKQNSASSLILDNFLLNNFRNALGGRMRLIVNGGAPIMKNVFEFICSAITPNIIQGYGLTETSAGVAVQEAPASDPTTVGQCGLSCQVRFRAVEGTDYDAKGEYPKGELLVKGPIVFQGYYKQPELTAEVLHDGWFATGDVCQLTEEKQIRIIDRAKQLVKLCQGEYISLTNLSEQYGRASKVAFIFVYANSQYDRPVALVIPKRNVIDSWISVGISEQQIPTNEKCQKEIIENLAEQFKLNGMRGFEKIDKVVLDTVEPTIENGLLTPSMKPQLNSIKKKYEPQLLELCK